MKPENLQPMQESFPLEKVAKELPRGADLVRAVLNGTVSVEDIPGREMTEEEARAAHDKLDKEFGVVENWDTLDLEE